MVLNSFLAGLAIFVGAGMVLLLGQPSRRVLAIMLALAAGVMLMVVACDLWPAAAKLSSLGGVVGGSLFGGVLMWGTGRLLTHSQGYLALGRQNMRTTGCLAFLGIALHDVLEGMAIAVGYEVMETLGASLVLAIGIHHIPEGIAMAAPLRMADVSGKMILLLALLTSLMTPIGVLAGWMLHDLSVEAMGFLLAAAGGAMGYLSLFELEPQARENSRIGARIGLVVGMVLMGGYFLWMAL